MLQTSTIRELLASEEAYQRLIRPVLECPDVRLIEGDFPGIVVENNLTEIHTRHLVARGMRHFAGADLWPDASQAAIKTIEYMEEMVFAYLAMHMSRGIEIGKQYPEWLNMTMATRKKIMDLDDDYHSRSEKTAEALVEQDHMLKVMMDKFLDIFVSNGTSAGYPEATGEDLLHIWDIWRVSMESAGIGFYVYGLELGQKEAELSQFDAIVGEIGS